MKNIFIVVLMIFSINCYANTKNVESLIVEVRKNLGNENYAIELGRYLQNKPKEKLIVKESLRHAYITSSRYREDAINLLTNSNIIDLKEKQNIEKQLKTYEGIVNQFKNNVAEIKTDVSYTTYRCDGVESLLTDMNAIVPFKRNLRISDVSAYQDFLQYLNRTNIVITHVPSASSVLNYVRTNTRIKFINLEEKIITNNATAVSMYSSVSDGKNTYLMFPYKLSIEDHSDLADLTAKQYAYFALNLSLVDRLTPEIYRTFTKIYRRNASLCLYHK